VIEEKVKRFSRFTSSEKEFSINFPSPGKEMIFPLYIVGKTCTYPDIRRQEEKNIFLYSNLKISFFRSKQQGKGEQKTSSRLHAESQRAQEKLDKVSYCFLCARVGVMNPVIEFKFRANSSNNKKKLCVLSKNSFFTDGLTKDTTIQYCR
jgi:hypothetical protein